jgi:predicted outer membrane repeat protein
MKKIWVFFMVVLLAVLSASPLVGATITVTNTNNDGAGSLRQAIVDANASGGDTIDFSLAYPATIALTSALTVRKSLTISGPGASRLFISETQPDRVFDIDGQVTVTISGVTIQNGSRQGANGGGIYSRGGTLTVSNSTLSGNSVSEAYGGGIYSRGGTLTVSDSTLSGNSAEYYGGGIYSDDSTVTVSNSVLSGNSVDNDGCGGGIYSYGGTLTVSNSTLSGNHADYGGSGGAICTGGGTVTVNNSALFGNSAFYGGGINSGGDGYRPGGGTVTVNNSTLSGNSAPAGGGGINNNGFNNAYGVSTVTVTNSTLSGNGTGGIYSRRGGGLLTAQNTILANSLGGNCGTIISSQGHNLSDDGTCFTSFTQSSDLNGIPAGLDPGGLQNNGGPTQTIALVPGSPAVDAIPLSPTNYCTAANGTTPFATDQRGGARPQGPACDIGAFELEGVSTLTFTISDRGTLSRITPESSSQPSAGYAKIQANSGSTTPSGLAIFGLRQNNVLVTEAAVPATAPILSGRIYAEISGSVNTGVAIANPGSAPATVSFYFTDANGNFGSGNVVIPANRQIAAFLDQAPFHGLKPLTGSFTFSSSSKVAAVALRGFTNERGEFLMTTLPVANLSVPAAVGSIQIFPHFVDGGGWRTEIALVNPTDSELAGTILFKDQSGTALTMTLDGRTNSSFVYSIPPRMSQKLATAGSAEAVLSGSVMILPTAQSVPPVGLAVFSLRQGSITVSQAGVVAMNSARAYRLYGEASGDFDKGAAGSMQTGLAIVNNSNATAVVAVELFRLDGSAIGLTGTLVVQAGGQTAKFLSQIPGLESLALPFKGVVRVSSLSAISVIGLRCSYNERNDFLFTTMPPMDESATATDAELVFPHFVQGGGYTTQFVLFSGSPGQQTSGAMQFVSQSGEALNVRLR